MAVENQETDDKIKEAKSEAPKVGGHEVHPEAVAEIFADNQKIDASGEEYLKFLEETIDIGDLVEPEAEAHDDLGLDEAHESESDANAPNESHGTGKEREQTKAHTMDLSWWETEEDEPIRLSVIQPKTTGAEAVPHKLDQATRNGEDADYWSSWKASPQEDGGKGAMAMADACYDRVKELTETGKLDAEEEVVVCDFSDSGKGVKDFLETVRQKDIANQTNVAARTKGVILCSPERAKTLRESGEYNKDGIEIQEVNVNDPKSIKLPNNTMVAMLDGTTNTMETHQLIRVNDGNKSKGKDVRDVKITTAVTGSEPLVVVDPDTGEIKTVQHYNWQRESHATPKGDPGAFTSQLIGRAVINGSVVKAEGKPHEGTTLERREDTIGEFMADKATPSRVYNFAPKVEELIKAVTEGVREDGMVLVGGHMRFDPDHSLPLTVLMQQDRIPLPKEEGKPQAYLLASPLRTWVTEAEQVYEGAEAASEDVKITRIGPGRGSSYDYIVIDRGKDKQVAAAKETIAGAVTAKGKSATAFLEKAQADLESMREAGYDPMRTVALIERKLAEAIDGDGKDLPPNPSLERNYDLHHDLARLFNEYGLPSEAARHADQAAKLLPIASSAKLEMAKAAMAAGRPRGAAAALDRARELSPNNPEVYQLGIQLAQEADDLEGEIENRYEYLRCASALEPREMMGELQALCEALERDYQMNADNQKDFKNVFQEDLLSGKLSLHTITIAEAKQIRAAETIIGARQAVQEFFANNPEISGEEMDRVVAKFNALWEATCPTGTIIDSDEEKVEGRLPRHAWADRPPENTRWIFTGLLNESDIDAPDPPEYLQELVRRADEEAHEGGEVAIPDGPQYEQLLASTINLGKVVNEENTELGSFEMSTQSLNVLVAGRTRMGKTTLIQEILRQTPAAGTKFIAMDLGTKEGLSAMVDELNAEGIPVARIEVNNPEAIPVSIDMFRPVEGCSIQEHIGTVLQIWQTAYDMPDPFPQILKLALYDVYAKNGWGVITEDEDQGLSEVHKVLMDPPTPTFQQLQEACLERAKHYKGDASNIGEFFRTRTEHMKSLDTSTFLHADRSNPIDWDKLLDSNVYIDLSRIRDPETRRLMASAFTLKLNQTLKYRRGLIGDELKNLLVLDEAGLLLESQPGDSPAREQAIENFANDLRQNGAYGIGVLFATQSPHKTNRVASSQTGVTIAFALKEDDIKAIAPDIGIEDDPEKRKRLFGFNKGRALAWQNGMPKALEIVVTPKPYPGKEAVEAAKQRPVPLPIKEEGALHYTNQELQDARRVARETKTAWWRVAVGTIALSHVSGIELPSKMPEQLQKQWKEMTQKDRRRALLVARTVVENALNERRNVLSSVYNPRVLGTSILNTFVGMLDGREPMGRGRHASPHFIVPEVGWARDYVGLVAPHDTDPPSNDTFAAPAQTAPGVPATASARVDEQKEELRRHPLSPEQSPNSADRAYEALVGENDGRPFWRDLRIVTRDPNPITRRRIVAVEFGYLPDQNYPGFSPLEEVLQLPKKLQTKKEEDNKKKPAAA